ncbi:hypothetical protein E2562_033979 [Oryza meyeriana var. granulata]|uniref:Uncharacterized protein n=1 Tax=Oryza meyeriana var. granulata TaxID=110450 RepID=A0A6G1C3F6_9ORYZ|nr:hypothetical protein E2562_033979 [Oryza meyeriana var. granulata]
MQKEKQAESWLAVPRPSKRPRPLAALRRRPRRPLAVPRRRPLPWPLAPPRPTRRSPRRAKVDAMVLAPPDASLVTCEAALVARERAFADACTRTSFGAPGSSVLDADDAMLAARLALHPNPDSQPYAAVESFHAM